MDKNKEKKCSKCQRYLETSEFNFHKTKGIQSNCKKCQSICNQEWKSKNKERRKLIDKKSRVKNAENRKIQKIAWCSKNRKKENERLKKYRKPRLTLNQIKQKKEDKYLQMGILEAAYKPFADAIRLIMKREEYYKKKIVVNKSEEQIQKRRSRDNEKYMYDPKFRLNKRMKNTIGKHLRGEKCGRHWENIVGWKIEDLMEHLSLQFNSEMNWNNYGKYWHVDHIIPIASFNFKTDKDLDFKRCWSLMNLQPLEARENLRKSNKILRRHYQTKEKLMMLVG